MRFINKLAYKGAQGLSKQLNHSHTQRGIYYYGLQVVIGAVVKGILLVSISALLGVLKPALIIMVSFALLRVFAGGYHMGTYGKCIAVSLGLFVLAALAVEYMKLSQLGLIIFLTSTWAILVVCLIRYAPADNPNRPITSQDEIRKFKILSLIYIAVSGMAQMWAFWNGYGWVSMAMCFGAILEVFSVIPPGKRFFGWLECKHQRW